MNPSPRPTYIHQYRELSVFNKLLIIYLKTPYLVTGELSYQSGKHDNINAPLARNTHQICHTFTTLYFQYHCLTGKPTSQLCWVKGQC